MSKYTLTVNCEDKEELDAYSQAMSNYLKVKTYYDEVLRPIRKYEVLTDDQAELLEKIIRKSSEHFYEDI